MREFAIRFHNIDDVNNFVKQMRDIGCDLDLLSEDRHYVVDAKSAMGIFSLDLSGQLTLRAYTDNPDILNDITNKLRNM